MAIKLLHTGDLHLDAPFLFLGEKGKSRRQELLATLDKLVKVATDEKVDLFLIAGNLFNSNNPSYTTIDLVADAFKTLDDAGIPVCLIPGSHDKYDANSIYRLYNFTDAAPNLTVFTDTMNQKVFNDLELTIYGKAVTGKGDPQSCLHNLAPTAGTKFHIALVHGLLDNLQAGPEEKEFFNADELEKSKMNYVALGGYHSFADCSQKTVQACYCGAPSMLNAQQKDCGYAVLVTIHPSGEVSVVPKRIDGSHFQFEEIEVDGACEIGQIIDAIKSKAHPQRFLEVWLTGACSFDLLIDAQAIEQELDRYFLKLRVVDKTHPKLEEIPVGELPENTVMGQFICMMKDELKSGTLEEKELTEKALKLGVGLLKGKRVFNDYQEDPIKQI